MTSDRRASMTGTEISGLAMLAMVLVTDDDDIQTITF